METTHSDGDKIIEFGGARRAMRGHIVNEVEAYWEALRAGRTVPSRSEVDPRGIERALEYSFILERVAPGVARFRLAGMHLSDLMGMEVRGMPLSTFFAPSGRAKLGEIVEAVFQGPGTADLTLSAESGIGKPNLTARLLILPLKSDLGDITRALGCLVAEGDIGRTPRRFEIVGSRLGTAVAGRPVTTAMAPAALELAEPRAAFTPAPPPAQEGGKPRRAHLRLVRSPD